MPWKERKIEQERLRFVALWTAGDRSKSELCRSFGVSRKTGYELMARYEAMGLDGLRDGSRRPQTHPNATSAEIVERIVAARRMYPSWGGRKLRGFFDAQIRASRGLRAAPSTPSWTAKGLCCIGTRVDALWGRSIGRASKRMRPTIRGASTSKGGFASAMARAATR